MQCRLCGCENNFDSFKVKELEMGFRDEFTYLLCKSCGTLQYIIIFYFYKRPNLAQHFSYTRIFDILKKQKVRNQSRTVQIHIYYITIIIFIKCKLNNTILNILRKKKQ